MSFLESQSTHSIKLRIVRRTVKLTMKALVMSQRLHDTSAQSPVPAIQQHQRDVTMDRFLTMGLELVRFILASELGRVSDSKGLLGILELVVWNLHCRITAEI